MGKNLGIALDLGTSGIRGQAVDMDSGAVHSTCLSLFHPLPGANVMDHLHFALDFGESSATGILRAAVNKIIQGLDVPVHNVVRVAVCGNPIQLSLFQGLSIKDLAYAGSRKLSTTKTFVPDRDGMILHGDQLPGLHLPDRCRVIIPPSVSHAVGADALAMILQSDLLHQKNTVLVTDYGTNAEMALCHGGRIITASAAAGPALEGQHLSCGMPAAPGAMTGLDARPGKGYRTSVLDNGMLPVQGPYINLERPGPVTGERRTIKGVTGAGLVAVLFEAIRAGHIRLPRILTPDTRLHIGNNLYIDEADLMAAGRAIGAIRAGHLTLCHEAGIGYGQIETMYMAGATGLYLNPLKAGHIGLLPSGATSIVQTGNTSLKMARDLVLDREKLGRMQDAARRLRPDHCMLASSEVFKKIYLLELAFWTEGMPMDRYRSLLARYGLEDIPLQNAPPRVRQETREHRHSGPGVTVIENIGQVVYRSFPGCTGCGACEEICPNIALTVKDEKTGPLLSLDQARCAGAACKRCERACTESVMTLDTFFGG
nr:methylamine methyltransferase corrinoid protein reductive activase [uncultured Desulfobacter sp.]